MKIRSNLKIRVLLTTVLCLGMLFLPMAAKAASCGAASCARAEASCEYTEKAALRDGTSVALTACSLPGTDLLSPETGEDSSFVIWISLLGISCVGVICLLCFGRKKRNDRKTKEDDTDRNDG